MNRRLNKIPQFARVDELPTGPCCDVHECKGYTSPFGHLPVDRFVRLETRHATPGLLAFVEELVVRRVASFFHQNQQKTRRLVIADGRQSAYHSALKASVQ